MFESAQAKTAAIMGGLALILISIVVGVGITKGGAASSVVGMFIAFLVFILGLPLTILTIFDINCAVVGQCNIWSWIKTVIVGFYTISVILMVIMVAVVAKKTDHVIESASNKPTSDPVA